MIDSENKFRVDPVPILLSSENEALRFFVRRDLLNEEPGSIKSLWELPETEKILIKQKPDGSWKYPSSQKNEHENENYNLLETYRQLRFLIEQFCMDKKHPSITIAAEYVLAHQSEQGISEGYLACNTHPNTMQGYSSYSSRGSCR